jgi:hypothetical protein
MRGAKMGKVMMGSADAIFHVQSTKMFKMVGEARTAYVNTPWTPTKVPISGYCGRMLLSRDSSIRKQNYVP